MAASLTRNTLAELRSASSLVRTFRPRGALPPKAYAVAELVAAGATPKESAVRIGVNVQTARQWVAAVRDEGVIR